MLDKKKYLVDFQNCAVIEKSTDDKVLHRWKLFIDQKGVHIINRQGVVYLTQENCEVL